MTTGERLVDISTLTSDTALQHFLNIDTGGGGDVVYMVQGILYGEVQKIVPLTGQVQKIELFTGVPRKQKMFIGEVQKIEPLRGRVSKINNLKGEI